MSRHVRVRRVVSYLCCLLALLNGPILSVALAADPSGGAVVAGAAAISQHGGGVNVLQSTDRAVINWNGFSLNAGQVANFQLPSASSAVLNRVITQNNPSQIYGAINSNGNVFLINPSGVLVGPSGTINVNGFTASALDIPNAEFMRGGALHFRGDSKASVINQGTINTGTGGAHLIGNQVINQGTITSQGGSIGLAAGQSVQLQGGGTYIQADAATIANGINEYASVINNTGTIRAVGAAQIGGEVYLVNTGGTVLQEGLIAAQQKASATETNGGVVKIDAGAGQAKIGGAIDVTGDRGGRVAITGQDVQLAGANINASGTTGGGQIQIGGGFQGRDVSIRNALTTSVDSQSLIQADSTRTGNAGGVIIWSDQTTRFAGSISARAFGLSGDGGMVEVSGKQDLAYTGSVRLSSLSGRFGTLLLDPRDLIVGATNTNNAQLNDQQILLADGTPPANTDFNITAAKLVTEVGNGNVVLQVSRDIRFDSNVIYNQSNSLTALAGRNVIFNASVQNNGSGDMHFVAGWDQSTAYNFATFSAATLASTTLFGNGGGAAGSITLGSTAQGVAVGSAGGATNFFAKDFSLNAGNSFDEFAQAGYNHVAAGIAASTNATGAINVYLTRDLTLLNGSATGTIAQIGHGGRNVDGTYSGTITVATGRDISLSGANLTGRYSVIGHGDEPASEADDNVSGNIMIRAGRDLTADTSFLGHLADSAGTYGSGNTWIGVGQNAPSTAGTGQLTTDVSGRLNSAATGELRLYMPSRADYQIAAGALLNGTAAVAPGTVPLPNEHGFYTFGNGPYLPISGSGNFAMYVGAVLIKVSGSGTSVYGTTPGAATYSLTSGTLLSGDTITSIGLTDNHATVVTSATSVGSIPFAILGTSLNANYKLHPDSAGLWSVTVAGLSIIPNAGQSKVYGATNPTLTFTTAGLVNGDTVSGSIARVAGENVGTYAYSLGSINAGSNYVPVLSTLVGVNDTFAINPATLTYVADPASRLYGASNPAFTGSVTGFVNSETQGTATTGTLAFNSAATATSNVGSYAITGSGLTANNGNYIFVQAAGNATALTINPATLTYVADPASRLYGASNPAFTGSVTGFVNSETQGTATTGTLAFNSAATATSNVGSYAITGSGLTANNGNYLFVQAAGNATALTINPATLTYVADPASRLYGASNPTFTGSVTGFVNSETQGTATTGTLAFNSAATATSNVGSYAITGSGLTANNGNYLFVQAAGNATALTINPATLTYVADPASRLYGASNPAFTGSVTGFVNSETQGTATTGTLAFNSAATATSNVGSYAITGSGLTANNGNYLFVQAAGNATALTINPATLTYVADPASRLYGASNPAFTGSVTGFVNSETQGTATTGTLAFNSAATATSNVGSYAITGSGLTANNGNYLFVQAAGNATALTINPATLTYVADPASRLYGASNPAFTGSVTGFVNSETQGTATTGTLAFNSAATATSNVGSYAITGSGLTANNGNYIFVQAAGNATALTINPATLTYVADPASRLYGASNPAFTGSVTGFVNSETQGTATTGTLAFNSAATATSNVGSYAITGSGLTANNGNYIFVQAAGNATALTINPATLTYVADPASRLYGASNPAFTGSVTGFVNSETQGTATTGTLAFNSAATATSNVGSYAITGSGLTANNGNYLFVQAAGNATALTINPATLTYVADPASRLYGASNPAFTGSVTGFVNSETQGTATTGTLAFNSAATATSNVGSYAITGSGLTANNGNYLFVQAAGNATALTINPATLTYVADPASRLYGASNPTFTGSVTGFVNSETQGTATTGTLAFNSAATATSNVGSYAITGSGLTANNGNYIFVQAAGNATALTINPATLTYVADPASRLYGASNPAFTGSVTGFVNSETQGTATTGTLAFNSAATATSNVGSYAITGSGLTANNGNYLFVQAAGNATALTINPATLTYVADPASRLYGASNPAFTGSVTGFVNSETQGTATTGTLAFNSAATATSNVGSYAITGSGLTANNGNYLFVQAAGNATALTINQAPLTITANNRTKTYGNTLTLGTTAFGSVGLKNGESIGGVTLTSAGAVATASVAGSTYLIVPSNPTGGTFSSSNYLISFVNGNLTVNKAPLLITALPQSKQYGDSFTFNGVPGSPGADVLVVGLRNSETIGNVALASPATSLTANAGLHGIFASNPTGGTFNIGNYNPTFVPSLFLVTRAPLTITAKDQSKFYGDSFSFTGSEFNSVGLKNGETIGSVSLTSAATSPTANVAGSPYAITASNPTGGTFNLNNYNASFVNGAFTVAKAPLTIVAHSGVKPFGVAFIFNGTTGFTAIGLKNGETVGSVTLTSLGAPVAAPVGAYSILASAPTGGSFTLGNYSPSFIPGVLVVGASQGNLTHDQFDRANLYWQTIHQYFFPLLGGNGNIRFSSSADTNDQRMAGMSSYELFGSE